MGPLRTPIIPASPTIVQIPGPEGDNLRAICVFAACGFFLDTDTYRLDQKALKPACDHQFDQGGNLIDSKPWFEWQYQPKERSFEEALVAYTQLFEEVVEEQVGDKRVILPLSGGLDSRTQAVALKQLGKEASAFSYSFEGGYPETTIAHEIAQSQNFDYTAFQIRHGYLWKVIEQLAEMNGCYSEFTHPRQMAVAEKLGNFGEVFSLGHWGDVLFDAGAPEELTHDRLADYALKKIVKKGGMELAEALWQAWGLDGSFKDYLTERVRSLLNGIRIDHVGAKFRAFKSLYWAPRWTSINLAVFNSVKPITLPYYDDRICKFICEMPEYYLANRRLQIAYVKQRAPKLANICWQEHKPFNLNNFHLNKVPYNLPYRINSKLKRTFKAAFGKPFIERNWELQFLGQENQKQLQHYLYSRDLADRVPREITAAFLKKFNQADQVFYSHPVSILLTLSLRAKLFPNG